MRTLSLMKLAFAVTLSACMASAQQAPDSTQQPAPTAKAATVTPPRPISTPNPPYTEAAKKAKTEGAVHLWVILGVDGVPKQVWVDKSLDPGLDQNAIDAVKRWRFQPARKDGQPVEVKFDVAVNYKLR
jgi:TonB family protein